MVKKEIKGVHAGPINRDKEREKLLNKVKREQSGETYFEIHAINDVGLTIFYVDNPNVFMKCWSKGTVFEYEKEDKSLVYYLTSHIREVMVRRVA